MKRTTTLAAALAVALTACNTDAPMQAHDHAHQGGLSLSSVNNPAGAQALAALRELTAPFHDLAAAQAAGYGLLALPPLTADDGCVSSLTDGGMGYHYTRGNNLADDSVSLLDPEFLVYAPKNGPRQNGEARTRLAAFDYFLPYSAKWPGPDDAGFVRAPQLHDFSTMRDLPDVTFAPSRFNGWMVHIWLWENNPGGLFSNWNATVPLCVGSAF